MDVFAVMQHRENTTEQTEDLQNLSACVGASGTVLAVTAEPSEEAMNEITQFSSADTELSPRVAKEIIFRRIWYQCLFNACQGHCPPSKPQILRVVLVQSFVTVNGAMLQS